MKRVVLCIIFSLIVFGISGCGSSAVSESPMSSETSVASLSYISAGFIEPAAVEENTETDAYQPTFLTTYRPAPPETTTSFEGELEYINKYMNKLQVFMDNGFNAFNVEAETTSDNPEYEFVLSYVVEDVLYQVYYNAADEDGTITGIMIVNDVTYDVVIEDNLEEEEDETKRNLVLTATLDDDTITITYTHKVEGEEEKEELVVEEFLDGVLREITIEIKQEEDTFKVSIEDGENSYAFKVSEEDGTKHYKLDYEVDGIKGTALINETVDEDGNPIYRYKIKEGDVEKTVDKDPKAKPDKNKNKDEHPEDESEDPNQSNDEETEDPNQTTEDPDEVDENNNNNNKDNDNKNKDKDNNGKNNDSDESSSSDDDSLFIDN